MNEPKPTVIVATEHESVVRFYAGHATNGGLHQTGQFTTTRQIEPTDLANMAVDLSATFGWLQVQPVAPPLKLHTNVAPAIVALPPAEPTGTLGADDKLRCTHAGCGKMIANQNMQRHLTNVHHLSRTAALAKVNLMRGEARKRAAIVDVVERHLAPPLKAKAIQLWKQRVLCPIEACGYIGQRNNMGTHLKGKRHGMRPTEVAAIVRDLPWLDAPRPRGAAGAVIAETITNPAIIAFVREHGTSTTREIADGIGHPVALVRKHLTRLGKNGALVDVTPPTVKVNEPHSWAVPSLPPQPLADAVIAASRIDSSTGPMYDDGSTPTVHERNDTNP